VYETFYAKYSDAKDVCPVLPPGTSWARNARRNTLEVLALGTGVGIIGLIVIVLIVVVVLRLL
jgi:hypothetical protein